MQNGDTTHIREWQAKIGINNLTNKKHFEAVLNLGQLFFVIKL
jgi:hypothetical protein